MNLYWNTVSEQLKNTLLTLMQAEILKSYRLVGGTALSLYMGHRMSIDIDLFTDADYGTIDYNAIDRYLNKTFPYASGDFGSDPAFGKSYLIGQDKDNVVKVDIYYTSEPFVQEVVDVDAVRLAALEDIIAMKVDVVQRGGRKKDFWDLHELLDRYEVAEMLQLHLEAFQWTHDRELIIEKFTDFQSADQDFDPLCLRGKEWIFVKEDIEDALKGLK
jgi:predicted nucleotidyltransferase component of viral defense system